MNAFAVLPLLSQSETKMNYFIQTQPSPDEGAHAQEVDEAEWRTEAKHSPYTRITYDHETSGLHLRFDLEPVDKV